MKYTMVIADDEPVVLKSQELFIKKEFPEIEIVGMAGNGLELKNMVERLEPDLAIVDIRMPGLTGIEAIELLQEQGCVTHFIIHTAYSDFEYVKKALDLRADGYLLKPGKREENIAAISKVCQLLDQERQEDQMQTHLKSALNAVNSVFGREVLLSVFSGDCDEAGFNLYCSVNNLVFHSGCIVTLLPKISSELDGRNLDVSLPVILNNRCDFLATATAHGIVLLLFIPETEPEPEKWCQKQAEAAAEGLREKFGAEYSIGMGKVYHEFSRMNASYQESVQNFQKGERQQEKQSQEAADKIQFYVTKAREYIVENFKKDISLTDCAECVGISPYYLSHIFKERTGDTFVEYLSRIRIEEAKNLALNKNLTVSDISSRCGYLNITYFCKVFKRMTGMTIGEYRKYTEL